jgi:excinuclease ABC subunit A
MLYIFDEPTTGLHFDDIQKLLTAFRKLLESGASVIIIEHNLDVIKSADWVIDLGPEGGSAGGKIVATGTPEQVARNPHSYTGKYLARALKNQQNGDVDSHVKAVKGGTQKTGSRSRGAKPAAERIPVEP